MLKINGNKFDQNVSRETLKELYDEMRARGIDVKLKKKKGRLSLTISPDFKQLDLNCLDCKISFDRKAIIYGCDLAFKDYDYNAIVETIRCSDCGKIIILGMK